MRSALKKWNMEELKLLRALYPTTNLMALQKFFKCSCFQIVMRAMLDAETRARTRRHLERLEVEQNKPAQTFQPFSLRGVD